MTSFRLIKLMKSLHIFKNKQIYIELYILYHEKVKILIFKWLREEIFIFPLSYILKGDASKSLPHKYLFLGASQIRFFNGPGGKSPFFIDLKYLRMMPARSLPHKK